MTETSEPRGITLCLSGGGLRATYFHLGVIWALRKLGRLKEVKNIYSVSGGSILAAHLALNWAKYTGSDHDAVAAARDLVDFAARDVRNRVVRRAIALVFLPLLNIFLRFFGNGIPCGRTAFLEAEYRALYGKADVSYLQVDGGPKFFVLGTTLLTGDVTIFSSEGYSRGESPPFGGKELLLSKAVAASSAFPPLFPPARFSAKDIGAEHKDLFGFRADLVMDGGVFDNLGYDIVHGKEGAAIISDAAARFDIPPNRWFWDIIARTSRATDILMKRAADKSLLNIASARNVTCVQIGKQGATGGVLAPEAEESVARIRTDLDEFNASAALGLVIIGSLRAMNDHRPGRLQNR